MTHTITFARSGITIEYDPVAHKLLSILDLADDAGLKLKRGCRTGYCGVCQIKLISGNVAPVYGDIPVPPNIGSILSCSYKPLSDIVVEA